MSLAEPLQRSLSDLRALAEPVDAFDAATATRTFRIAGGDYAGMVLLPPLARLVSREAPGIDPRFRFVEKNMVPPCLEDGRIDLALLVTPGLAKRFEVEPLFEGTFTCGVRVGHPVLGRVMDAPTFAGLDHLLVTDRGDERGRIDELLERVGLSRRIALTVVDAGLVDTVDKAFAAGRRFRAKDVELVFLYASTYALSSTVLPAVRRLGVPVILLNLQPDARIDFAAFNALGDRTRMTGEWLAWCGACPVPEIANVLKRSGVPFHQVTGVLTGDAHVAAELDGWVTAARVAHVMRHNRMGLLGRYYNGMLDIYTDQTLQLATFGGHMEVLELDELAAIRREVEDDAVAERVRLFDRAFDVQPDCPAAELARAARTSLALDRLVERHRLGSLAYYYESVPGHEHGDLIGSVILGNSLLTARGVPVAGEYEIKNAQAMKILDALGAGGSYAEYYTADFADDVVLFGHDGPGHIAIAEGRTKVRPLQVYHGKPGSGLSVEMSVRHGPVTLLSVIEHGGSLALLVAEGESVPGPILEIGNTNGRYRFPPGARRFIEAWNAQGPAHHCAIGTGHVGSVLER